MIASPPLSEPSAGLAETMPGLNHGPLVWTSSAPSTREIEVASTTLCLYVAAVGGRSTVRVNCTERAKLSGIAPDGDCVVE